MKDPAMHLQAMRMGNPFRVQLAVGVCEAVEGMFLMLWR